MAEYLELGYLPTVLIILGLIALISFAFRHGLNSILAFWTIYILTRPLGASIRDYLSQSKAVGGLDLGTTTTSIMFLVAIIISVSYLLVTKIDQIEITSQTEFKEKYAKPSTVIMQTISMIMLFVILGGVGFVVHQSQIKNQPLVQIITTDPRVTYPNLRP